MSKFELSLAKNYVPSWTLVDGIRELFQNAIDQETQNPDNAMSFVYDRVNGILDICNAQSTLTTKTLLLGTTSKADDSATIGQFGEGYKVATLVLLRCGKEVTFYNYGAKEIWHTRFVNSRRYGAEVLTFDVQKQAFWDYTPNNDLTVEIKGITPDEYDNILVPSNLYLQDKQDAGTVTRYGNILKEDKYKGTVFVNGLFVCNYKEYKYGYNFKPECIHLDRDRKLVSDFDLRWLASKMWITQGDAAADLILEGAADVEYVADNCWLASNDDRDKLLDAVYNKFVVSYGANAVPVSSQTEAALVPLGYMPVYGSCSTARVIKSSSLWHEPVKDEKTEQTPMEELWKWFNEETLSLDDNVRRKFEEIYDRLECQIKELQ